VLDESGEAAPGSVRAALKELVTLAREDGRARRTWAVLGEMTTGDVVEHDGIGRLAVRLDVARLVVVGASRPAHGLHQGAVMEGSWGEESVLLPDTAAAIALLDAELAPGDIVLVKGSDAVGLRAVADHLLPRREVS
jgi:UDP-N-acetylmuramoyl-tripeptide--D-alanyl-D-alanine ligase